MSFDLKIINGDLVIKKSQLQTVVDSEKLIQDILKMCLTTTGSNPIHPWYGSYLSRTIVGNALDPSILISIAKNQLNNSFENFKELQDIQVKSLQDVSADELLSGISDISILRNLNDPRMYNVIIKAFTKGLKPISTAFRVSTI